MERYKVIRKKDGVITMLGTDGSITHVNEGVFRDTYMKVKDFFSTLYKIGGNIVMKIRGKVAPVIDACQCALSNKDNVRLVVADSDKSQMEELGVPTYSVDDVLEDMPHKVDYSELLLDVLKNKFVSAYKQSHGKGKVNEAHWDVRKPKDANGIDSEFYGNDAEEPIPAAAKHIYWDGKPGSHKGEIDKALSSKDPNTVYMNIFSTDLTFYDTAETTQMVSNYIRSVFNREVYKGSYRSEGLTAGGKRAGGLQTDKVPIIMGIGGIGKTSIIKSVCDSIFNAGNITGKDERGNDLYDLTPSKKALGGMMSLNRHGWSSVNRPRIEYIKCQNLTNRDIALAVKVGGAIVKDAEGNAIMNSGYNRGESNVYYGDADFDGYDSTERNGGSQLVGVIGKEELDKSRDDMRRHIKEPLKYSKDAARLTPTGIIPLIDVSSLTDDEVLEIDRMIPPTLIILDELFCAESGALSMLMGLARGDRKIGGSLYLPTKCAVVATTNRLADFDKDSNAAKRIREFMSYGPQIKRFNIISYIPNVTEWYDGWATKEGDQHGYGIPTNIHPDILDFLNPHEGGHPENAFRILNIVSGDLVAKTSGKDHMKPRTTVSSPRDWTDLSDDYCVYYAEFIEELDETDDSEERKEIITRFINTVESLCKQSVGTADGREFLTSVKWKYKFIDLDFFRSLYTNNFGQTGRKNGYDLEYKNAESGAFEKFSYDRCKKALDERTLISNILRGGSKYTSSYNDFAKTKGTNVWDNMFYNMAIYFDCPPKVNGKVYTFDNVNNANKNRLFTFTSEFIKKLISNMQNDLVGVPNGTRLSPTQEKQCKDRILNIMGDLATVIIYSKEKVDDDTNV